MSREALSAELEMSCVCLALLESVLEMLSCTFSMFWTTVTSQTSSEKRRTNRHTVNRLLRLAQERDSQKGRTRFRVFTW